MPRRVVEASARGMVTNAAGGVGGDDRQIARQVMALRGHRAVLAMWLSYPAGVGLQN